MILFTFNNDDLFPAPFNMKVISKLLFGLRLSISIKGKKGEVALTTTDKTKFAEEKTLADVKVGDKLTAEYSEKDGKMMAWKVMTKKEMKEMKKEHKEKEEK